MKADERAKYIDDLITSCLGLLRDKGAEYSRGEEDVNSNFKRVAAAIGSDPITVAYVYMAKHLDSVANYVKTRELPSGEPIQGRIHDAINYLAIMGSLIEELEQETVPAQDFFARLEAEDPPRELPNLRKAMEATPPWADPSYVQNMAAHPHAESFDTVMTHTDGEAWGISPLPHAHDRETGEEIWVEF